MLRQTWFRSTQLSMRKLFYLFVNYVVLFLTCCLILYFEPYISTRWAKSGKKNAGMKAEALFHRIIKTNKSGKYGIKEPDQITYNSLVEAWSKTRSSAAAEKANQWLLKMDESCRLGPKAYSYVAVIGAWSRCGKPGAVFNAEEVFDMMRAKYTAGNSFVRPNIDAYNNLIAAWANSGRDDAAENSERILRQMEAEYEAGSVFVIPNALTYSSVINGASLVKNHVFEVWTRR